MVFLAAGTDGYSGVSSYAQFITVLVIFVIVLAVTALTTKWIANYQKQQSSNENIEVIETTRIANNKYIQIIRAGKKYIVIAVCKDSVTMLCEVQEEMLKERKTVQSFHFREFLDRAVKKDGAASKESEGSQLHEEK